MINIKTATAAMAIKIPKLIPALKIPSIAEQPVNNSIAVKRTMLIRALFFMIPEF